MIWTMHYRCARCRTRYQARWDAASPARIEEESRCPNCQSPIRVYIGQMPEPDGIGEETI